ncbi:Alkaline phosphatase synthesis sensor protein phoR [uncultured Clostridium sp.]|nr:Alkaline phosphatase synthesis sensor protein phoR [uncultured Clostridium sp.]
MSNDMIGFAYIDKKVFHKLLNIYCLIMTVCFVFFYILKCDISISIIVLSATTYMCTYMFISYSKFHQKKFILIKMHLIFLLLYYMGIMVSDGASIIDKIVYFGFDEGILLDVTVYTTLIPYLILTKYNEEDKYGISIEFLLYSIVMIYIFIINYNYSLNNITIWDGYRSIYIISIIYLLIMNIQFKKYTLRRDDEVNVCKYIIVTLLIMDGVALFIKSITIAYYINLTQIIMVNLFLVVYLYNLNKFNNSIYFKSQYRKNFELEIENKSIIEKNEKLEVSKEKLLELNRLYNDFMRLITIPIAIINKENNRLIYVNDTFIKACEMKAFRDVINQKIDNLFKFDSIEKYNMVNDNGHIIGYREINGQTKIFDINYVVFSKYEVVLIFNDMTERENIDRIKRELNRRRENELMKNNFLSNISHDLKTPIGVIYSAIQLENVYVDYKNKELIEKYNNTCKDNCLYLTRLTNNLIDISRITEKSLAPNLINYNIVYFVEETIDYIIDFAKVKNVEIVFDTEEEEVFIKFDKEFTERVIVNLLSNAIKYSKEKSIVNINIINQRDCVLIEIIDKGIGMSKEFVEQAFDMYSMEEQKEVGINKGTGIGLFVVYNLLKLQGATIDVDTELGKGSKFTLTFKKE